MHTARPLKRTVSSPSIMGSFQNTVKYYFEVCIPQRLMINQNGNNLLGSPESGTLLVGVTGWLLLVLVCFIGAALVGSEIKRHRYETELIRNSAWNDIWKKSPTFGFSKPIHKPCLV